MAAGSAIPKAARKPSTHSISLEMVSDCIARNARQARCHLDPKTAPEFSVFIEQGSGVGWPCAARAGLWSRACFWKRELKQEFGCPSNPIPGPRVFYSPREPWPLQKRHSQRAEESTRASEIPDGLV